MNKSKIGKKVLEGEIRHLSKAPNLPPGPWRKQGGSQKRKMWLGQWKNRWNRAPWRFWLKQG